MTEMKARLEELKVRGMEEPWVAGLFADDIVLADNEGTLQRTVDEV